MGQNALFRVRVMPRTVPLLTFMVSSTVMVKKFSRAVLLAAATLLAGCNMVVMSPSGDVATQQRDLLVTSVLLMLIIIVPVIVLTLLFAWRYRAKNQREDDNYDPDWHHSTMLELIIWSAPLLIIIALGAITWVSTHKLDPYRPIDRISPGRAVPAGVKPLEVDVVALDWKWLFIYPEQGIATVNEMAAPVDRPIHFKITSSTMMNSFFIPALAGQIYAMPGMETQLHAVINKPGDFEGFSANYSGAGFSHMRFVFKGMDDAQFNQWVAKARSGSALTRDAYKQLAKPSENNPVSRYSAVAPGLFKDVVELCVDPSGQCMSQMMKPNVKSAQAHGEQSTGMGGMPLPRPHAAGAH